MTRTTTSGLLGLLLFLASASAAICQTGSPQMKHEHEPGHSFGNAETWAKEFDDPARDVWQKPDQILDALQLAPTSFSEQAPAARRDYFAALGDR
jgi:hypothetical protein